MRICYQRGIEFNDDIWYSIRLRPDRNDGQLSDFQRARLRKIGAWRFRQGSPNGPDIFVDLDGVIPIV